MLVEQASLRALRVLCGSFFLQRVVAEGWPRGRGVAMSRRGCLSFPLDRGRELGVIADPAQVAHPLLEIRSGIGYRLIVDRRAKLGENEVEEERGFQVTDLLVHVLREVFAERGHGVFPGVVGYRNRR